MPHDRGEKTGKRPRLFISYARGDDEPFVRRLYDYLRGRGFDHVWFDRESLPSRQLTFHQEIRDAIRLETDRLIYVGGPMAASSDYVREEWLFALELDKVVIPILRTGPYSVLPKPLAAVHCEDFRDDTLFEHSAGKLVANLMRREPPLGELCGVPRLPRFFLDRPEPVHRIETRLLAHLQQPASGAGSESITVVQGMGGIGKSVLASAVAHSADVRRAFPDGIVWVHVGQSPNVPQLLRDATRHLGDPGAFESAAQGRAVLKYLLADKAVLVVLDDVWLASDVEAFDVTGPRCSSLITTRDAGVAHAFRSECIGASLLTDEEAVQLLASASGIEPDELPPEAREVIAECDCLPLAIALSGSMARKRNGDWKSVLERLRRADLDKIADRQAFNPQHRSLWRVVEASALALSGEEQRRFAELVVFKSASVEAVATLWSHTAGLTTLDSQDLLINLAERSLIRLDVPPGGRPEQRRVSMHDLVHDFAIRKAGDFGALQVSLLDAYRVVCPDGWATGPNDGYFFQHLVRHLVAADRGAEVRQLQLDFRWIAAKLTAAGIEALLEDYQHLDGPVSAPRLVSEALRASSHVLSRRPDELVGQLHGRLLGVGDRNVANLLYDAKTQAARPSICPTVGSLTQPGGPLFRTIDSYEGLCTTVALSRDKKRALTDGRGASRTECLNLWDVEHGLLIRRLEGDAGSPRVCEISADGVTAVSGGWDGALRVWDIETGTLVHTLRGGGEKIGAVALNAAATRALAGSSAGAVTLWDLKRGELLHVFEGHEGWVDAVRFSVDERLALSGSFDNTFRLWDLERRESLGVLGHHDSWVTAMAINADFTRVLAAYEGGTLKLWNPQTSTAILTMKGHRESVTTLTMSTDEKLALAGAQYGATQLWDLERGTLLRTLSPGGGVAALSHDGRLAISSSGWRVRIWNLDREEAVPRPQRHQARVRAIALTRDGKRAISGSFDDTLKVWDAEQGALIHTLHGHKNAVDCVAVSADGTLGLSGSFDRTLRLWDLEAGRGIAVLGEHTKTVTAAALSLDGTRALSGGDDSVLKLWDVAGRSVIRTFHGHSAGIVAVAFSDDGTRGLSACRWSLNVWDLETGHTIHSAKRVGAVSAVACVDAKRVLWDSSFWDFDRGGVQIEFRDIEPFVAALSADGKGALLGQYGNATLKWHDLTTGLCRATLTFDTECLSLAIAADRIVAGDRYGDVHFCELLVPN